MTLGWCGCKTYSIKGHFYAASRRWRYVPRLLLFVNPPGYRSVSFLLSKNSFLFGFFPARKYLFARRNGTENFVSDSFSALLTLKPGYGNINANIFCGGCYHGTHSDHRDPQSVWEREEWRLRRMPDFLPVRLQDQLRYRQSAVRKQVIAHN